MTKNPQINSSHINTKLFPNGRHPTAVLAHTLLQPSGTAAATCSQRGEGLKWAGGGCMDVSRIHRAGSTAYGAACCLQRCMSVYHHDSMVGTGTAPLQQGYSQMVAFSFFLNLFSFFFSFFSFLPWRRWSKLRGRGRKIKKKRIMVFKHRGWWVYR